MKKEKSSVIVGCGYRKQKVEKPHSIVICPGSMELLFRTGKKRKPLRKKSHILLARYLADQMTVAESLQAHRKAFCLGNILPDLRPSFVTKKHEFFGTFHEVQEKLEVLVEKDPSEYNERVYWRQLGEAMHYIADYFTFPHNRTYTGTLMEHNQYEKYLKKDLKECIKSGRADLHLKQNIRFDSFAHLVEYIKEKHEEYLKKERNIKDDIRYIVSVCYQVIQGIFQLCTRKMPVQFRMALAA